MAHKDEMNWSYLAGKMCDGLRGKGINDTRVLEAIRQIPRHCFVDRAMFLQAYQDNALPIGCGQTISQPFIQARMTELLELQEDEKILEIGTGSGYQTAILAQFSRRVYTIERHQQLGQRSRALLRELGYANITFKIGDGTRGWTSQKPFDKIIVTAGAPVQSSALADQLTEGGILLMPVGDRDVQHLTLYRKQNGQIVEQKADSVVFVPLIGDRGWKQ